MGHPRETDLALYAGNDIGFVSQKRLQWHIRSCEHCRAVVEQYRILCAELSDPPEIDLDWNRLSAEMHANIRLGLAAGACVEPPLHRGPSFSFNPRLAVAFASLTVLAAAGLLLRHSAPVAIVHEIPTLAATGAGLELRSGENSVMLLNHRGAKADQSVGAQGEIRARYVDAETGSVTINNVYLED